MELADLLNGLRRAPWLSAGRPILLNAGFTIHRGFDNTVRQALTERADPTREKRLKKALTEHLVAGEKMIRLVKLEAGERVQLDDWVKGKRQTSNPLTDAFPGVASKADIVTHKDLAPSSAGSIELKNGCAALYTASRWYLDRVELPTSKLKAGAAEGFEKLIGIQRVFLQTYEAIWVPAKGNFVCVATDLPRGVPKQFAEASQVALQAQIRQQLGRQLSYFNFWPAIDGLYEANDGKLVDYGFTVAGKQVNHHKARRSSECLRKAVYDKAGAAAVGDDLELFKVAMRWEVKQDDDLNSEPEVLLPGTAADMGKLKPTIDYAVLRDGLNSRDLDFVTSKLALHMK